MADQDIFAIAADALPETIEINGTVYRRESNDVDVTVGLIAKYEAIAQRCHISLAQAVWFYSIATNTDFYREMPV